MKIILLEDVPKIGKKYQVKDVSNGHALNFLIPKGLAQEATKRNLKSLEGQIKTHQKKRKDQDRLVIKNLGKLKDKSLEIKAKTNDKGHLFAGIHKEKIAEEVKNQVGVEIQPEMLEMNDPIKEVGDHQLTVRVGDKTTALNLKIVSE